MALKLFNTLSRSVEEFRPQDAAGRTVGMYCCGPTVHNYAHIGNFRTFVCTDLLRRYLEFRGWKVRHVMNITDVEDKIIAAVRKSGRTLAEYTAEYEKAFLDDFDALLCRRPHELPHATGFMPSIIRLIEALLQQGFAYRAADGSVYFSIDKYRAAGRKYGQLLNLNLEELRVTQRVSSDEYAKEAVADFALWKARVAEDGEVFWLSPWGEGRPGWHIECSAMSMELLGPSFDLHLGGEDLVFPHHEDEIAQSEGSRAADAGTFVRHWMHVAHLLVEGRKMSKSLGNYFTLRDLLAKGFTGREIRFLLLSSHYRESFNFTLEGLSGARTALGRIDELIGKLREIAGSVAASEPDPGLMTQFTAALDDDLNVAAAWGHIFEWVRATNKAIADGSLSSAQALVQLAAWEKLDTVLAVGVKPATSEVPAELLALLEKRQAARKSKDFARADAIRGELKDRGWTIEDTPKGPRLKPMAH